MHQSMLKESSCFCFRQFRIPMVFKEILNSEI
jgi:hypothetical protein